MSLLFAVAVILFVLWLAGFAINIAGAAIHLLLVLAVIALIVGFLSGRNTAKY